jgi:hypothetical protein
MGLSFLLKLFQVFVIKTIRQRDIHDIPATITRLVPTYQQNSVSQGVKSINRSKWTAKVLDPQFTHMAMLLTIDATAV